MSKIDKLSNLAKERHLAPGEQAVAVVMGTCESHLRGKKLTREGVFLAAAGRLIFFTKGIFSEASEVFPLASISSVEIGKTLLGHHFRLKLAAGDVEMKWIQHGDVGRFLSFVQTHAGQDAAQRAHAAISSVGRDSAQRTLDAAPRPPNQSTPTASAQDFRPPNSSASNADARARALFQLFIRAGLAMLGCVAVMIFIASTGSPSVGWLAIVVTVGLSAMAVANKPPKIRELVRGNTALSVALLVSTCAGGVTAIGEASVASERAALIAEQQVHAEAARKASESAETRKRSELTAISPSVKANLAALSKQAHDSLAAADWSRSKELLGAADALVAPYRKHRLEGLVEGTEFQSLDDIRTAIANQDREDRVLRTNAAMSIHVDEAQKAKADGQWIAAKTAIDAALAAQRDCQRDGTVEDLDQRLLKRAAALEAEVSMRVEKDQDIAAAKQTAEERVRDYQRLLQSAEQLVAAAKWVEADSALTALANGTEEIEPEVRAQFPRDFSIARFRKQVSRMLAVVRPKAALIVVCGPKPMCGGWDGECVGLERAVAANAHDPESIDVEKCTEPVLTEKACWVTKCDVRGKNAFGANVLNRSTFSMSALGIEQL